MLRPQIMSERAKELPGETHLHDRLLYVRQRFKVEFVMMKSTFDGKKGRTVIRKIILFSSGRVF
jgi:hypothetical protein